MKKLVNFLLSFVSYSITVINLKTKYTAKLFDRILQPEQIIDCKLFDYLKFKYKQTFLKEVAIL